MFATMFHYIPLGAASVCSPELRGGWSVSAKRSARLRLLHYRSPNSTAYLTHLPSCTIMELKIQDQFKKYFNIEPIKRKCSCIAIGYSLDKENN